MNTIISWRTLIILVFCFSVLVICYGYGVHTGLNSRITAGVELDASSITIALSRLWFHLHEGYVGYKQIYTALFQILVPDGSSNNFNNFALLSDPDTIQRAFDNVRKILPSELPSYSFLSPSFISIMMEDVGLTDYYTLSFLLFGVHPTSMYNLYFLLFAGSLLLFVIEYRQQFFPMVLLALIVSLFPIFFFSDFFSYLMPSINSNRFLSTLGIIPIAYTLCIYFKPVANLNRMQMFRLVCQALLFAFALSIRRSAQWQLIALLLFASFVAVKLYWPYRHSLLQLECLRLLQHPVIVAALLFMIVVSSYQTVQKSMMSSEYQTDSSPMGHAVWHSAYVGLALHPNWVKVSPSVTAVTDVNDGIAFHPFARYMNERGLNPLSPKTGTYLFGLHELVTKQQYFHFIRYHKLFALQLYGYYKPKAIIWSLWERVQKISLSCLIYCIFMSLLLGYLIAMYAPKDENIQPKKLLYVSALFLVVSHLPSLFAYPRMENGDDLWMFAIFASLCLTMLTTILVSKKSRLLLT